MRLSSRRTIANDNANRLWCVSRGFKNFKIDSAKRNVFALSICFDCKVNTTSSGRAIDDCRPSCSREFEMPLQKVGVKVCLDNFCDLQVVRACIV